MPWTLSHPAAVLPLRRFCPERADFAALVIGSMTPDFGYHMPRFEIASFAHTLPGSFLICLPTGFLLWLVFYFVRRPVCFILPTPHREALTSVCAASPPFGLGRGAIVILSLLVGAWTHLIWDAFTHRTGWVVRQISWLQEPVFVVGADSFRGYYLLQQFSTFIGALILGVTYLHWLRRRLATPRGKAPADRWRYFLWATIVTLAALGSIPFAAEAPRAYQGFLAFRVFAFWTAIYSISIAVPLIILSSVIIYALLKPSRS